MYVCVCKAVTERQVKQAAKEGAGSLRDLRDRLGVTEECGRCAKCALECLRAHEAQNARSGQHGMFDLIPEAA
jgi:bacterioferritin-associated ferredoxin